MVFFAALFWNQNVFTQSIVPQQQPVIETQTVFLMPQVRIYADPALPAETTGLRNVSTREITRQIRLQLSMDPRFLVITPTQTQQLMFSMTENEENIRTSLRFGNSFSQLAIDAYTTYNLQIALEHLNEAIDYYQHTFAAWIEPDQIADAWHYLALIYMELANQQENSYNAAAQTTHAFSELIRHDPARQISPQLYSMSIVQAYRTAYASILASNNVGITEEEAAWFSQTLQANLIIDISIMTDQNGTQVRTVIYEQNRGRFIVESIENVIPDTQEIINAVTFAISQAIACTPLQIPDIIEDIDTGAFYFSSNGSFLYYAKQPASFLSYGFKINGSYMFDNNAGLFASVSSLYGMHDLEYTILTPVDTLQFQTGISFASRTNHSRFEFQTGIEIARTSQLQATDNFWCRASRGEIITYDETRSCEQNDLINHSAQLRAGVRLNSTFNAHLTGPFWFTLQLGGTLYIFPIDQPTELDFPLDTGTGLMYRF